MFEWPSAKSLNEIHDHWEDYYSDPKNRRESVREILGVKIVSGTVHPFDVFSLSKGRYITLPDKPDMRQKLLAFLILETGLVSFVRRESDYIGYAFQRNKEDIFKW